MTMNSLKSLPIRKLNVQDIAGIWRAGVEDIPDKDREKQVLLTRAKRILKESGEEWNKYHTHG